MTIFYYLINALLLPPALTFTVNFYRYRGKEINFRRLIIGKSIIILTAVITVLQFIFPSIIGALDRNKDALLSGEIWRLVTPLFIQPLGIWQCIINALFMLLFMPVVEHFYKNSILIIYFAAGIAGQIANFYWNKGGGGSSTAIYGIIGAICVYVFTNKNTFPKVYTFLCVAPIIGAIALCFYQDGHAPGLLVGAACGVIIFKAKRAS